MRSKDSDEKERGTGERGLTSPIPRFYFFALLFSLHRSPLSERLEQANVYKVVRVAGQSKPTMRLTSDANDFGNAKSHARIETSVRRVSAWLSCGQVGVLWLLKALLVFFTLRVLPSVLDSDEVR